MNGIACGDPEPDVQFWDNYLDAQGNGWFKDRRGWRSLNLNRPAMEWSQIPEHCFPMKTVNEFFADRHQETP